MEKYYVTGMSCAACSARVEKSVSQLDNVSSCSVNLLTNSMIVEGSATKEEITQAVIKAGYGIKEEMIDSNKAENNQPLENDEFKILRKRFIISMLFLLVLMYFSMGVMMFNFPNIKLLENPLNMGLFQLLLTIIIMILNKKFFINGFSSLIGLHPNMDTLVALGSSAAFIYSLALLFVMNDAMYVNDMHLVHQSMHDMYFESSAMILTLITFGKMLEAYSKGKTTNALKELMNLTPKTAIIEVDGVEKQVAIKDLKIDDIVIVKPGESIACDGIVVSGHSAVDESCLSGESIPVDKEEGSQVYQATINTYGLLKVKVNRLMEDTTLSQIIQMVQDAASTKAPIAKIADQVSLIFVPTVIAISIITFIVWMFFNVSIGYALARAISVLVISCPCALGLATPVAIMVANGVGAKKQVMFKNATALEVCGKSQIVLLDKTGTITKGQPSVVDIITNEINKDEFIQIAAMMEQYSEHPLAKAIMNYANEKQIDYDKADQFEALSGSGIFVKKDSDHYYAGNIRFISQYIKLTNDQIKQANALANEGKTVLYFAKNKTFLGMISVSDQIKEDSIEAIKQLKKMGMYVVMLTGDQKLSAKAIANQVGVDDVIYEVLPQQKEGVVKRFQRFGKVMMVGDGMNDAIALTRADIGVAIGAGSDIAIDAADIVLMKNSLLDVVGAIRLSKATLKTIKQNLFWAFFYNAIGIPLAAGCFIHLLGFELSPMFAAAAMSLSSFSVVSNALRLNIFNMYDASKDHSRNKIEIRKEDLQMKKTIEIEGMMCPHCEKTVTKVLMNLPQVLDAQVSHKDNQAIIELSDDICDDVLIKTIEDEDFKVIAIK